MATLPRALPQLESNGSALSMEPARLDFLEAADPGLPLPALRERYRAQGYLWLRGLLPRSDVLSFRRRYFEALAGCGLLRPGTDPGAGVYAGGGEDGPAIGRRLVQIVRWAAYEGFCLSPALVRFLEGFLGGPVFLHKRKLIRHTRPGDPHCTGAHYDLVYLRGGTDRLCTAWIPLGDTPVEMGGLCYLEGSDAWGRRLEAEHAARAAGLTPEERISAFNRQMTGGWLTKDLASLAAETGLRWLVADYAAGDVVLHSPYMIHASTMNVDPAGRIRLSTDIRYQLVTDEIDERWQHDWRPDDGL
jgi:hypothetical protein